MKLKTMLTHRQAMILIGLFLFSLVALATDIAEARWRMFGRRSNSYSGTRSSYGAPANCYSGTDQERCQAEAEYMANRGIFAHVGGLIGAFEGWGAGGRSCATCVPGSGMRLTGDGWASGPGGSFRVRSWR